MRCGAERLRLLGVDAPEMSRCARAQCVAGNPIASGDNLRRLIAGKPMRVERVGRDRYGRILALIWSGRVNQSCAQIAGGFAAYRPDWDNNKRVARVCG